MLTLAVTLSLTLAAVPPPKPTPGSRCKEAFATMAREMDLAEFYAGAQKKGWTDAAEKIPAYFEPHCQALKDDAFACVAKAKGKEMRGCRDAMEALGKAMVRYSEEKEPGGFERFQLRAMQTEPKVVLRTAQTTAQMLVADAPDAKTFRFPASAGPSPAADCCATAEKACPPNPKDFEHASWEALGVHPEGKVRYHYTLTTSGVGPAATFVLRAEGDPQCKGVKDIWEVKGRMEKGALVSDPPVNLTPPKDPAAAPAPAPAAKPTVR